MEGLASLRAPSCRRSSCDGRRAPRDGPTHSGSPTRPLRRDLVRMVWSTLRGSPGRRRPDRQTAGEGASCSRSQMHTGNRVLRQSSVKKSEGKIVNPVLGARTEPCSRRTWRRSSSGRRRSRRTTPCRNRPRRALMSNTSKIMYPETPLCQHREAPTLTCRRSP
jgi:hypothetical protein